MRRVPARFPALELVVIALIITAFVLGRKNASADDISPRGTKPAMMLLTSLPLVFPEEFSIEGGGSETLSALETRYRVISISATDKRSLGQAKLLLMAHALPQTAEALVALDGWVRDGGRLLLLADPKLDWPSKLPLGDKLRPPPSFADTGLLAHWGLKLIRSEIGGPISVEIGPNSIIFSSVGWLQNDGTKCELLANGIAARCNIGRGKVTIVADADFLDVEQVRNTDRDESTELLLRELARLER